MACRQEKLCRLRINKPLINKQHHQPCCQGCELGAWRRQGRITLNGEDRMSNCIGMSSVPAPNDVPYAGTCSCANAIPQTPDQVPAKPPATQYSTHLTHKKVM